MNYTECFNRSCDGLQLVCSPFFVVWCPRWHQAWSIATAATLRPSGAPVGIRHGVLPRLRLCARPGAPVGIRHGVLPRLRLCARPGALVGIRHGVLPRRQLCARPGALVGIRHGVLPRRRLCARLVPSLASGMEYCHGCNFAPVPGATTLHYTRYTISQILGILHPCPLVIDLIEHHRY